MEVVDLPLSLLGEIFQRHLAVRYIAQRVTQDKTVKIAKPVLCKQLPIKENNANIWNKQIYNKKIN